MMDTAFVWGAGTASFQIEGAENERGETVWDMFCRREGAIRGGDTTEVTCDHVHRFKEDVALMKELGLQSYRLSLCWSRILPDGVGRVNQAGVDFYNALIDELLANGIKPLVGLFAWDYPYELYKKGGWLNPDSPKWFEEYARVCMDLFSDRVEWWETINEAQSFVESGHHFGEHAPGLRLSEEDFLQVCHSVHLSHGYAVRCIRQHAKRKPCIGFAVVSNIFLPENPDSPADVEEARRRMFDDKGPYLATNGLWIDPVFRGRYGDNLQKAFDTYHIAVSDEDLVLISQPVDFLGVNIYSAQTVRAPGSRSRQGGSPLGYAKTAFGWRVTPEALYWGPRLMHERYGVPIIITENGMSGTDWVSLDGRVHDAARVDFLHRYLREMKKAFEDGVPVKGYYHWSLMDNFECAAGNEERFGIVYVDFVTQQRIIKDSGYWYKTVIESNGENL